MNKHKKVTKAKEKYISKTRDLPNSDKSSINMLTTNAADLRSKAKCLKDLVKLFNISIFSVQETHYKKKGKLTLDNFIIFEAIRSKEGGGSMLGIHVSHQPVLISEYSDTFELIVTEIQVAKKHIRVITGYGPQETWDLNIKMQFFIALEDEIAKAAIEDKSIICMGDMNSKLGPDHIPNDPKKITENGIILAGIIERNALTVVNSLQGKCTGLITRERNTVNGVEKSIIDFVMVSQDLVKEVRRMIIDDERKYVLTRLTKTKKGTVKKESDHNTIFTELDIKWKPDTKQYKQEVYNLKDKESQRSFKEDTDNTKELSNIIDKEDEVDKGTKKFLKRINGFITKHFKKVKVKENVDKELEGFYKQKAELKNKEDIASKQKLADIEAEMAEKYAEDMVKKIREELKGVNSEDGGWNSGHLWKLRKKISPRPSDPPTAMENTDGVLLTDPIEIQKEAIKYFEQLFRHPNRPRLHQNTDMERKTVQNAIKDVCPRKNRPMDYGRCRNCSKRFEKWNLKRPIWLCKRTL